MQVAGVGLPTVLVLGNAQGVVIVEARTKRIAESILNENGHTIFTFRGRVKQLPPITCDNLTQRTIHFVVTQDPVWGDGYESLRVIIDGKPLCCNLLVGHGEELPYVTYVDSTHFEVSDDPNQPGVVILRERGFLNNDIETEGTMRIDMTIADRALDMRRMD